LHSINLASEKQGTTWVFDGMQVNTPKTTVPGAFSAGQHPKLTSMQAT
jgi:hypothetical protein